MLLMMVRWILERPIHRDAFVRDVVSVTVSQHSQSLSHRRVFAVRLRDACLGTPLNGRTHTDAHTHTHTITHTDTHTHRHTHTHSTLFDVDNTQPAYNNNVCFVLLEVHLNWLLCLSLIIDVLPIRLSSVRQMNGKQMKVAVVPVWVGGWVMGQVGSAACSHV